MRTHGSPKLSHDCPPTFRKRGTQPRVDNDTQCLKQSVRTSSPCAPWAESFHHLVETIPSVVEFNANSAEPNPRLVEHIPKLIKTKLVEPNSKLAETPDAKLYLSRPRTKMGDPKARGRNR